MFDKIIDNSILILTNMYPSKNDNQGIFVKEQVDILKPLLSAHVDVYNIKDKYKKFGYFISVMEILKRILRFNVNIIHVHYGLTFIPLFFLYPLIFLMRIKIILTYHGSDIMGNRFVNFISNIGGLLSDRIVVVNMNMTSYLFDKNKKKIICIPCSVDDNYFKYKKKVDFDNNKLKILFPADPERKVKNYPLFKEVINIIRDKGMEVDYRYLKKSSRNEVREHIYWSDFVLLTSLREGSPQVVKESIFSGTPVVSTDVGDVREILSGLDSCYISDSPDDMANFIIANYKNRLDYYKIQSKINIYGSDSISKKLIKIYNF